MTDRPTPEQILDHAFVTFVAGDGERGVRGKSGVEHVWALAEHGYVIVHPDDAIPINRIHLDPDNDSILAHIAAAAEQEQT